jgi:hypothetical protein
MYGFGFNQSRNTTLLHRKRICLAMNSPIPALSCHVEMSETRLPTNDLIYHWRVRCLAMDVCHNIYNTILQHPVTLCRPDFLVHFCCLCPTSVDLHPFSLYCNSHYMFQPNRTPSYVQVVCFRELLSCFSIVTIAGSFLCW